METDIASQKRRLWELKLIIVAQKIKNNILFSSHSVEMVIRFMDPDPFSWGEVFVEIGIDLHRIKTFFLYLFIASHTNTISHQHFKTQ